MTYVAPASAAGPGTSEILAGVNASRAANGRGALILSGDLSAIAASWAQHMAHSNSLSHNPNLAAQVRGWRKIGENVGYGQSPTQVESAFMSSAPHRANILDADFTQIGIGVATADGTTWVTQVFRRPMSNPEKKTPEKKAHKKPTPQRSTSPARASRSTPRKRERPRVDRKQTGGGDLAKRIATARSDLTYGRHDVLQHAFDYTSSMRTVAG